MSTFSPSASRAHKPTYLAKHPPVHKQQCPVRLPELLRELEARQHVRARGVRELERRDEEPNACAAGETLRQVALGPAARVEPRQVPSFVLAEQTSFVHHAAYLVGETVIGRVNGGRAEG